MARDPTGAAQRRRENLATSRLIITDDNYAPDAGRLSCIHARALKAHNKFLLPKGHRAVGNLSKKLARP